MGVKVQTRYQTFYTTAMSDVQTTMDVDTTPANSVGYATIRRGYPDQEDIKHTGTSGLQLTGLLRGLSPIALTDTEIIGLKKPHTLNNPTSANTVEGTTLHYIINNKTDVDDDETVTGAWLFNSATGLQVTNGIKTSALQYAPNSINDVGALPILGFTGIASAVNYLRFKNAATGGKPVLEAVGTDNNIIVEFLAKGTGYFILPDKSQLKTNAAPIQPQDIVNKAYVDAQIASSSVGDASTTQKGVSEEATDAEVTAGTTNGGTGARLFINPGSTTASANIPGKVVILGSGGKINQNLISIEAFYAPLTDVIGDTFSAGDISSNANLAYQSPIDNKWYKVPNGAGLRQYYRLGLVMQAANAGDTGKAVMLKGRYTGKAFSNINPTFSASTIGGGSPCGLDSGSKIIAAYRISNNGNAECELNTGSIRAMRVNLPEGPLGVQLFLENNAEQSGQKPAAYPNTTSSLPPLGAILGQTSIPAANFAGVMQDHPISFSGVKIPAGVNFYLTFQKLFSPSSNYYFIEGTVNGALISDTLGGWTGAGGNGYYSLTTNSLSPIGYAVKVGNSSGTYGIEGYRSQLWSRVIGRVTGMNEFYFDPEECRHTVEGFSGYNNLSTALNNFISLPFCPNELHIKVGRILRATATIANNHNGYIKGNRVGGQNTYPSVVTGNGQNLGASFPADDFLAPAAGGVVGISEAFVPAVGSGAQNYLHAVRYEGGVRLFSGYPGGAANVQQNVVGYFLQGGAFDIEAE